MKYSASICRNAFEAHLIFIILILIAFRPGQTSLEENRELIDGITGFEDSVRKCEYRPLTQHVGQHATTPNTNSWFN